MLTVTDAAAQAISMLTASDSNANGSHQAGLRFSVQEETNEGAALAVTVAQHPDEGDQVVTSSEGAQVFLQPEAADYLDDKVLDVQKNVKGELNFALREQGQTDSI
ncbi:iron-sulfur cluster biosynthesis family protein [Goodfellowiella coeruleoviolacea]|uniref:Fe-S cluster assembly iron-binding protein IscA n=1 Tax=Goodfellowiella coeruleoviolacea TaxID=334858 RepID=A0AAE3GBQ8_9PSEU|nr:iron-sulfur cluster biosynthesis family protein [Goodfellowiella coeruleoviolacea]MCP2164159.1 Fe-S cluster assembly iron-binding protein IscA [Goodfellowiella coeruleoviolacea]